MNIIVTRTRRMYDIIMVFYIIDEISCRVANLPRKKTSLSYGFWMYNEDEIKNDCAAIIL